MSREARIAARIVAAIDPLLPAWCAISIDADWLHIAIEGRWEVSVALLPSEGLPDREAHLACNILDAIQDAIVRTSTTPWPPASNPTDLPLPGAAVHEETLLAWFGPDANPTVALSPIDLATI